MCRDRERGVCVRECVPGSGERGAVVRTYPHSAHETGQHKFKIIQVSFKPFARHKKAANLAVPTQAMHTGMVPCVKDTDRQHSPKHI